MATRGPFCDNHPDRLALHPTGGIHLRVSVNVGANQYTMDACPECVREFANLFPPSDPKLDGSSREPSWNGVQDLAEAMVKGQK